MSKHLLVVAGGTGGHIFPGIAVAETLKHAGWTVSWIGTADRMEADVVPKHHIEIDFIEVKGVRGNGLKRLLSAPWMVTKAIKDAIAVIRKRQPDVILAMGGMLLVLLELRLNCLGYHWLSMNKMPLQGSAIVAYLA